MAAPPPGEDLPQAATTPVPENQPDRPMLVSFTQAVALFAHAMPFFVYEDVIHTAASLARKLKVDMKTVKGEPLDCVLDLLAMDAKDDVLLQSIVLRKRMAAGKTTTPPARDGRERDRLFGIALAVCEGAVMRNSIGGQQEGYLTCVLWLLLSSLGVIKTMPRSAAQDLYQAMAGSAAEPAAVARGLASAVVVDLLDGLADLERSMHRTADVAKLGLPPFFTLAPLSVVLTRDWLPTPFADLEVAATLASRVPASQWSEDVAGRFRLGDLVPRGMHADLADFYQPFFDLPFCVLSLEQGVALIESVLASPYNTPVGHLMRLLKCCGHAGGKTEDERFEVLTAAAALVLTHSVDSMCHRAMAVDPNVAHMVIQMTEGLICGPMPRHHLGTSPSRSAIMGYCAHWLVTLLRLLMQKTRGYVRDLQERQRLSSALDIVVKGEEQNFAAVAIRNFAMRVLGDPRWYPRMAGQEGDEADETAYEARIRFVYSECFWFNAHTVQDAIAVVSLAHLPREAERTEQQDTPQKPL